MKVTRVCKTCGVEFIGDHRRKYCDKHTDTEHNAYMREFLKRPEERRKAVARHNRYMAKPGVREKWNRMNRARNWQLKVETLDAYGGKCRCCGEAEIKFLTLHHAEGKGADQREALGLKRHGSSGVQFYAHLRRLGFPQDLGLEVLCFNCHMAISKWGTCPHKA